MNPTSSRRRRAFCCPRTLCGCGSPAKRSRKCPTRRARCGSTSRAGAGTTICSPRPARASRICRGSSKAREVSAFLSPEIRRPPGVSAGDEFRSRAAPATMPPRRSASAPSQRAKGLFRLGTSGVVFSVTDHYVSLPERTLHAFCHALPGRWHGMSVMLSAASALSWIAGVIGRGEEIGACVDAAEAFARSTVDVVAAPIFLPYLTGERTPYNDPAATGLFAGLRRRPWRRRARLRRDGGRRVRLRRRRRRAGRGGRAPDPTMLVGGGARCGFWAQMIADVTGLTIELAGGRGGGRGARRRAARDAGGRRRRRGDDLRAAGGAARIPARRGPGGRSRSASATLSRAVRRRKGGAVKTSCHGFEGVPTPSLRAKRSNPATVQGAEARSIWRRRFRKDDPVRRAGCKPRRWIASLRSQ